MRTLTDATGSVTATYRTDEWGIPTQTTGTSGQPFRFTGEPLDATGLLYLRARYYDPGLGRFLSRDSWPGATSSPQTLNRYAYATGNPTTLSDPSGHCAVDTFADAAFIAFDVLSLVFGPEKERETNQLALTADLAGAAIPCATGAGLVVRAGKAAEQGIAVVGHSRHGYVELARWLEARHFDVGGAWNAMFDAERWMLNQRFLDDVIEAGDDVLLATPINQVSPGSYLEREVDYLLSHGYLLSPDGWKLIAP